MVKLFETSIWVFYTAHFATLFSLRYPLTLAPACVARKGRQEQGRCGRNMAFNLCKLAKHYATAAAMETVGFIFSGIWDGIGEMGWGI